MQMSFRQSLVDFRNEPSLIQAPLLLGSGRVRWVSTFDSLSRAMGDVAVGDLTVIELLNLLDRVSAELRRRQVSGGIVDNQDTYSTTSFERVGFDSPGNQQPVTSAPLLTPNGAALTIGATAAMRRLHFEAEAILTASLKASIEQPASD